MLKLQGVKILTHQDLHDYFDLPEILSGPEAFLRFPDFAEREAVSGPLCQAVQAILSNSDSPAVYLAGGFPWELPVSPLARLYWDRNRPQRQLLEQSILSQDWSANKKNNVLFLLCAIHLLAGVDLGEPSSLLGPFLIAQPDSGRTNLVQVCWDGGMVTAHPLPPEPDLVEGIYYIRPFGFDRGDVCFALREYVNIVSSLGNIRILLLPEEGTQPLGAVELAHGQRVVFQVAEDKLVGLVPDLSPSGRHCFARTATAKGPLFMRCALGAPRSGDRDFFYDTDATDGILQFAADGGRGFAGIVQGRPRLFSEEDLDGLEQLEQPLVSVHLDGDLYIAQGSDGRVFSNHLYAKAWEDVAWVESFQDGAAYGISLTGDIVSTDPVLSRHINSRGKGRKALFASVWGESFFVRYTDGSAETNQELHLPHHDIQRVCCTAQGPLILTLQGELYFRGKRIAASVREALLCHDQIVAKGTGGQLSFYDEFGQRLRGIALC